MKIYLDNCAPGRLTDDQSQPRLRQEAEAVQAVLSQVVAGVHVWVASQVSQIEILANPDTRRRNSALEFLSAASLMLELTSPLAAQARAMRQHGFGDMDALHLTMALAAGCDVLLTTDDRFLRLAARTPGIPPGFVRNPVDFSL